MNDTLGDRIKRYEAASRHCLTINTPVVIRVDGKAFHTWTRSLEHPFDQNLINAMRLATRATAKQMSGFKLAYTQSDEASFLITDTDSPEQQGWFGYELNKLISVSASLFTGYFNSFITNPSCTPAAFDARAFNVPAEDAPNVFIWRQRDWERNSLSMFARSVFSHTELQGKNKSEVHEMLHQRGLNWADLDSVLKNGTFVARDFDYDDSFRFRCSSEKLDYYGIAGLIQAAAAE